MRIPLGVVAVVIMIAAALSLAPLPSQAVSEINWSNKRDAARAHATAIKQAWGRLASWIERRPRGTDPDLLQVRGPHVWLWGPSSRGIQAGHTFGIVTQGNPPNVPPIWNPVWTDRGLSFVFCDQTLAVFADHNVVLRGADMPTVAVEGGLQIIRGTQAQGTPQSGYPGMTIPDCMRPLPDGHVALVATAIDPFAWGATKRRNEHDDWEASCPNPDGDPAATVGKIRYAQTRPIELHPWSGADMDRWPDLCRDRPAAGGTFSYTGPVYGAVTGVLPEHGECAPPGTAGAHIVDAIVNDGCRAPTLIGGRRGARWHFYDALCVEAATGATAAIDGGPSAHTAVISENDGSVFFKSADYDPPGPPEQVPADLPPIPACDDIRPYCPGPYTDGGPVGSHTLIEKHRWLWKEPCSDDICVGRGSGWETNKDRPYTEPGGSAGTGVTGVAKGDQWIRENFVGCYREEVDSPCASRCSCPDGYTGGIPSGHPEIRWYYHDHDSRSSSNPHIIRQDTCACSACIAPPPEDCEGEAETGGGGCGNQNTQDADGPGNDHDNDGVDAGDDPDDNDAGVGFGDDPGGAD